MGWFKDLITEFVKSCEPHKCEHVNMMFISA